MVTPSCPTEVLTTALVRTILSNFDMLAGMIVMLLYPLISSIKAIESPYKIDDQQWLTYWVLYSFVTLVEQSFWQIFYWIPFWGKIKLIGACWLVLPQFNGAAFVYDYFVKKKLLKHTTEESNIMLARLMSPSACSSVQYLLENHGQNALEKVIEAATKDAHKYKSSSAKELQS